MILRGKTHSYNLGKHFQDFFFGMLKSALFKTTLDASSFFAYFEFLINIRTKMN